MKFQALKSSLLHIYYTGQPDTIRKGRDSMARYIRILIIFSAFLLVIPMAVLLFEKEEKPSEKAEKLSIPNPDVVLILNNETQKLSEIPLDEYLTGCVLAQIPYNFEDEALKAQAIICRTYIFSRKLSEQSSPTESLRGADVSDSKDYQSYYSEEKAKEYYGDSYEAALERACKAVLETDGMYLSFNGRPATTAYHPVSAGFTESALDVWGVAIPYLVSVKSESDLSVEGNYQELEISKAELFARLTTAFEIKAYEESPSDLEIYISDKTKNNTAKTVTISLSDEEKIIPARDIASLLGLNSCNFSLEEKDGSYIIKCKGCGHLVGLSQWGANSMAADGKTCYEILSHYFPSTSVSEL